MSYQEVSPQNIPQIGISKFFYKSADSYFIKSPCILTDGQILFKNKMYELVDIPDWDIHVIPFELKEVCLKGFVFTIIGVDLRAGELIKRSHRLDNCELPCSWVLIDLDYSNPDNKGNEIRNYIDGE